MDPIDKFENQRIDYDTDVVLVDDIRSNFSL